MSQGFYPQDKSQKLRAIDPVGFIDYDPSLVPTVGVKGTLVVQSGTSNVWQKQDDGRTANWTLFGASASPSGPAGGELTGTYPNPSLDNAAVIGKLLTAFVVQWGEVTAADSIFTSIQKLAGNSALTPLAINDDVSVPDGWVWSRPYGTKLTGTSKITLLGSAKLIIR